MAIRGVVPNRIIPSGMGYGWAEWIEAHGLSPYHPERHSLAVQRSWRQEAMRRFRAKWRRLRDGGDVALVYQQGGRAQLLSDVRADLRLAMRRYPVRNPYASCPCHPMRLGTPSAKEAGLVAVADPVRYLQSFARQG